MKRKQFIFITAIALILLTVGSVVLATQLRNKSKTIDSYAEIARSPEAENYVLELKKTEPPVIDTDETEIKDITETKEETAEESTEVEPTKKDTQETESKEKPSDPAEKFYTEEIDVTNSSSQNNTSVRSEAAPSEETPSQTGSRKASHSETETHKSASSETNVEQTDPDKIGPAETEASVTAPLESESHETEPIDTEPQETEPTETEPQETQAPERNDPKAPNFTVYDESGNSVTLSDYFGKPIVLNFWASWCAPCKHEMPDFNSKYLELGDEVQFLMVNLTGYDTISDAKNVIESAGYSFPVFYDTNSEAASTYSVSAFPTTYFIDAEGYLIAKAVGAINAATLQKGIDMIK